MMLSKKALPNFSPCSSMNTQPIGIFDSGLGGLSVWQEICKILPAESTIYYADSANCPYGVRTKAEIITLSENIVEYLLDKDAKMIVVACNTVTTAAIAHLREKYSVPFVGIEPAIKPATLYTKTGKIGVLATQSTLSSDKFQDIRAYYTANNAIEVFTQIGYGLVEAVEKQAMNNPETIELLETYLGNLLAHEVDQIVLGCTHYPFLLPQMQAIVGGQASFINPAPAVARQTKVMLEKYSLLQQSSALPTHTVKTSGSRAILEDFLASIHLIL
jgi:glutamate racemase